MTRNYCAEIAAAVGDFLEEEEWEFSFNEKEGFFAFEVPAKGVFKSLYYRIYIGSSDYLVYTVCPLGVEEDDKYTLLAMADFLNRVNFRLGNGSFECDMETGMIRYRVYVDCDHRVPSPQVIRNSITCPRQMFEVYGSGIIDIYFGNMLPHQAIDRYLTDAEK